MVLEGLVEFGDAAIVNAGGCGCDEESISFRAILWIEKQDQISRTAAWANGFQWQFK